MPVQLRLGRRDDLAALVEWLNPPAFLAATNSTSMTQDERSAARRHFENAMQNGDCLIVVLDNIRIGAILVDRTGDVRSERLIRYLPRLRLDWLRLLPKILTEFTRHSSSEDMLPPHQLARERLVPQVPSGGNINRQPYRSSGKRVLLLGPSARNEWPVKELEKHGYSVSMGTHHQEILSREPFDLVVSSGYHLRIPASICNDFAGRIINIHAASLPWGRGIGTTLFAVLLDYPVGTSVHLIDSGLDTGPLLCESATHWTPTDTLRTLYQRLIFDVNALFARFLDDLTAGSATQEDQQELDPHAYSRSRVQFETVLELCPLGYDTPLADILMLSDAMQCVSAVRQDHSHRC